MYFYSKMLLHFQLMHMQSIIILTVVHFKYTKLQINAKP